MKLVAVTSCAAGIAHTYMAAEGISKACKKLGIDCKVETQGCMGPENCLDERDIQEADVILFSNQITILDEERFDGYEDKIIRIQPGKILGDANCIAVALKERGLL